MTAPRNRRASKVSRGGAATSRSKAVPGCASATRAANRRANHPPGYMRGQNPPPAEPTRAAARRSRSLPARRSLQHQGSERDRPSGLLCSPRRRASESGHRPAADARKGLRGCVRARLGHYQNADPRVPLHISRVRGKPTDVDEEAHLACWQNERHHRDRGIASMQRAE